MPRRASSLANTSRWQIEVKSPQPVLPAGRYLGKPLGAGAGPANEAGLQREAIREAGKRGITPLGFVNTRKHPETAELLRKHDGKTGAQLKAEGK